MPKMLSKYVTIPPELPETPSLPIRQRLKLWLGGPFGYSYVPPRYVQVIYKDGAYTEVRGPGIIRHNAWSETLGPFIKVAGMFQSYNFEDLITKDNQLVVMELKSPLSYDPRRAPQLAPTMIRLNPAVYSEISATYFRWALMGLTSQFFAHELSRTDVREHIEKKLTEVLTAELAFFGLKPGRRVQILKLYLPPMLQDRLNQIAQRRQGILAGMEFNSSDYRRALVTEVIEQMGKSGPGESFVNFTELLQGVIEEHNAASPPQIIDHRPAALGSSTPESDPKPGPRPTGADPIPPADEKDDYGHGDRS